MGFLGTGWSFPIATDVDLLCQTSGPMKMSRDDEKIVQAIWIILTTSPGERVMRGDFGCGLNKLVFTNLSEATLGQVVNEVKAALAKWEPRIEVLAVDAAPSPDQPNVLIINIDYLVPLTNSRFNLVYPYFLS